MEIHYTWYQYDCTAKIEYDGDTFIGKMSAVTGEFVLQSQESNDIKLTLTKN